RDERAPVHRHRRLLGSVAAVADRRGGDSCAFQAVEEGQRELDVDGRGERDLAAVLSDDALEPAGHDHGQRPLELHVLRSQPDDPARIDVDAVHGYLSGESYWAAGRARETVERLVREAARVVGVYRDGEQVGFARAVTDGVSVAYLADVYVLPEHRGRGLGKE